VPSFQRIQTGWRRSEFRRRKSTLASLPSVLLLCIVQALEFVDGPVFPNRTLTSTPWKASGAWSGQVCNLFRPLSTKPLQVKCLLKFLLGKVGCVRLAVLGDRRIYPQLRCGLDATCWGRGYVVWGWFEVIWHGFFISVVQRRHGARVNSGGGRPGNSAKENTSLSLWFYGLREWFLLRA